MTSNDWQERVHAMLAAGNIDGATEALLRGVGPEVHGFLVATVHDSDQAGDVFSMFCEDIWRGLAGFRGAASLRTWSYRVARHAAARLRRDPYLRRVARDRQSAIGRVEWEIRSASAVWRRTVVKDRVRKLRESLETEEREILVMRIDRGMDWADIARVLLDEADDDSEDEGVVKKKAAAVRKRFERIKEKLKSLASEFP